MDVQREALTERVERIAPQGRLDAVTVPTLETALNDCLSNKRIQLIVDFSAVNYISSSGLRVLLTARRKAQEAGGDVVLCSMSPRVREVFEMIGFDKLFRVFDRADEAAAVLAKPAVAS